MFSLPSKNSFGFSPRNQWLAALGASIEKLRRRLNSSRGRQFDNSNRYENYMHLNHAFNQRKDYSEIVTESFDILFKYDLDRRIISYYDDVIKLHRSRTKDCTVGLKNLVGLAHSISIQW